MGGLLDGLQTILQAVATAFGSTFGVLLVTLGIAGAAVAVIWFHHPMSLLWKTGLVGAVLLACGAIAQALSTGGVG